MCCVCLDEEDTDCCSYQCVTCNDGFVCWGCMGKKDPHGSIFVCESNGGIEYMENAIRCPCCRSLNWKYHFNQIISVTFGMDLADYDDDNYPPAIKLYVKNQLMAERE